MSTTGKKCKNCGSSEIEVDSARGDAVCTNCGSVLEDNIIVAEVQFEEGGHGTSNAIGQFVSADSKGGSTKFGASFHVGGGSESREVTLRKARNGIVHLGQQLRLNQHCIDTACGFFKMALSRNMTRGRRNTHIHAACIYLSCRTEGTAHLLIDISDVLQICCYELGRTYVKLSQALCINVPSVDPCLYILRFASKLEFGSKTQQVTNTALRLVQRMKRDSIHSGRRPSGLCGAALLIASRLHEFNRTIGDVLKVVKVHESTVRKRLMEFGDTPSSTLTLEEFMSVDLEEEQDPPSFKAARKKDKERLQKLMEEKDMGGLTDLQKQIEKHLEATGTKGRRKWHQVGTEQVEAERFIEESTRGTIKEIIDEYENRETENDAPIKELGPNIASIGLPASLDDTSNAPTQTRDVEINLDLDDDIDDEELDSYIMTEPECKAKGELWHELNADFLQKQKEREERLQKEREEGKPEKKSRRRPTKKSKMGPTNSAGEAIEKIIQEKKISAKINYDVLKNLNTTVSTSGDQQLEEEEDGDTVQQIKRRRLSSTVYENNLTSMRKYGKKAKIADMGLPYVDETPSEESKAQPQVPDVDEDDEEEFEDEDQEVRPEYDTTNEMDIRQMLQHHHTAEAGDGDGYGGYGDDDFEDY